MEVDESQRIGSSEIKAGQNEDPEENRTKIKTNLEILLSQNDILPLLKKIRKEKSKNKGNVSLTKYIVKNNKVVIF